MEKETIVFGAARPPIHIYTTDLRKGLRYRGMHSHSAIEIVRVNSGEMTCLLMDEPLQIRPDQIVIINGNVGHRLMSDDANITYLQFDASDYQDATSYESYRNLCEFVSHSYEQPYVIFSNNAPLQAILDKIEQRYGEDEENSNRYLKAHLYELIAFMYEHGVLAQSSLSIQQIQKIEAIVQYIDTHIGSPISLDDISREIKYSKHTICHTFKKVTGATVFDYINYLRIRCAVDMIRQGKLTVLEIATECGFSSATYFNRVFKSLMGCAPSKYRK
jgi:AraC-like DNA-binding protein